jgi:predicted RNA-binding Zn-ribbon protein involved in translation (DUF1610 family)
MSNFRYELESPKITGQRQQKVHCPKCGKKEFVRIFDTREGVMLEDFGRCDREKCGYDVRPPQEYESPYQKSSGFQSAKRNFSPPKPPPVYYLSEESKAQIFKDHSQNTFFRALRLHGFTDEQVSQIQALYHLGSLGKYCVFPQIDSVGRFRSGQGILYNPETASRVKDVMPKWIHKHFPKEGTTLEQCLFGEHLLKAFPQLPVGIVESAKTACIASVLYPSPMIWLATGGKENLQPLERCSLLKGRAILLFPDTPKEADQRKPFEVWTTKANELNAKGFQIKVQSFFEKLYEEGKVRGGYDLGDFLLEAKAKAVPMAAKPPPQVLENVTPPQANAETLEHIGTTKNALKADNEPLGHIGTDGNALKADNEPFSLPIGINDLKWVWGCLEVSQGLRLDANKLLNKLQEEPSEADYFKLRELYFQAVKDYKATLEPQGQAPEAPPETDFNPQTARALIQRLQRKDLPQSLSIEYEKGRTRSIEPNVPLMVKCYSEIIAKDPKTSEWYFRRLEALEAALNRLGIRSARVELEALEAA